jgi:hypothetical protein
MPVPACAWDSTVPFGYEEVHLMGYGCPIQSITVNRKQRCKWINLTRKMENENINS